MNWNMSSRICKYYSAPFLRNNTNQFDHRNCYSTHLLRYLYAKLSLACFAQYAPSAITATDVEITTSETGEELASQHTEVSTETKELSSVVTSPEERHIGEMKMDDTLLQNVMLYEKIRDQWSRVLQEMGIQPSIKSTECPDEDAYACAMELVEANFQKAPPLSVAQWTVIRDYFQEIGKKIIEK
jgi:hypothetical protein